MIGIRRLLFGTALTVAATASDVTFAFANGVNAERAPGRSRTTSVTPGDFYVRGGAVLAWLSGTRFEDKNCSSDRLRRPCMDAGRAWTAPPWALRAIFQEPPVSKPASAMLPRGGCASRPPFNTARKFSFNAAAPTFCRPRAVRTSRPTCPPSQPF